MAALVSWLPLLLRRRKREALLAAAASWPQVTAKLLIGKVVAKDLLAEGGSSFQEFQVEIPFYFTLEGHVAGSYFGGHLRTAPVSDSEGHRLLRTLPEDTPVQVRYDPQNPDRTVTLPEDNAGFGATLWPG